MKRWRGWGDDATTYPMPESARPFLVEAVGQPTPRKDISREEILKKVPKSRLKASGTDQN